VVELIKMVLLMNFAVTAVKLLADELAIEKTAHVTPDTL
jgi:hypothetical protein